MMLVKSQKPTQRAFHFLLWHHALDSGASHIRTIGAYGETGNHARRVHGQQESHAATCLREFHPDFPHIHTHALAITNKNVIRELIRLIESPETSESEGKKIEIGI